MVISAMYESVRKIFPPCTVVILSNHMPDLTLLILDRLRIMNLIRVSTYITIRKVWVENNNNNDV